MEWARHNGYVVLTHDLDFGTLLALSHGAGPSVIQVRAQDVSPGSLGNTVVRALRLCGRDLREGALVVVDERRVRVRILPIGRG